MKLSIYSRAIEVGPMLDVALEVSNGTHLVTRRETDVIAAETAPALRPSCLMAAISRPDVLAARPRLPPSDVSAT